MLLRKGISDLLRAKKPKQELIFTVPLQIVHLKIWSLYMGQVSKNGQSKICGRQPLKNLKYGLSKQINITSGFLKAVFHKFHLVHS